MPLGPGKHDNALTKALEVAGAKCGFLVIIEHNGHVSFDAQLAGADTAKLPGALRRLADIIANLLPPSES